MIDCDFGDWGEASLRVNLRDERSRYRGFEIEGSEYEIGIC